MTTPAEAQAIVRSQGLCGAIAPDGTRVCVLAPGDHEHTWSPPRVDIEKIRRRTSEVTPGSLRYINSSGEHVICGTVDRDLMMAVIERDVVIAMLCEIEQARDTEALAASSTYDHEPRKPRKPDQILVDRGDWRRASGLTTCVTCGCPFADHASVRGYEWLTRLCDGRLVKL